MGSKKMDREGILHEQNALLEEKSTKILEEFDKVMATSLSIASPMKGTIEDESGLKPADNIKVLGKGSKLRPEVLAEALNHFNKKCQILQENSNALAIQKNKKVEIQNEIERQWAAEERERNANQATAKNTRQMLDRLQKQIDDQERKLSDRQLLNVNLKKQRYELQQELDRVETSPRGNPSRLKSLINDKEKLTALLHQTRLRHPNLIHQLNKQKEERRNRIHQLDKQNAHLLRVFQKQTQLINNLQKQKSNITMDN